MKVIMRVLVGLAAFTVVLLLTIIWLIIWPFRQVGRGLSSVGLALVRYGERL